VILTTVPPGSLAYHRSRASRSAHARTARASRRSERGRETRVRGRRAERLSRAERRRGGGRYASTRRGRRYEARRSRRHKIYYESRETVSPSIRPASSGIPTDRVTEIQRALIKEGYLQGQASGQYDDSTIAAMRQFQTDNGFPASGLPSAPSLKRLGVSKRSNDGYAVPINSATEDLKKQQTSPQVRKGKTSAPGTNQ
jgi:hypothetical protein